MAYTKKAWLDDPAGGTPITAAELNRMEDGIDGALSGASGGSSTRGHVVYVWNSGTSLFALAPGQADDGISPREYIGGTTSPVTAVAGYSARTGDKWVH